MKYVVTGACGFIGSHLVDALKESGNEVVLVDNLLTGSPGNLGKDGPPVLSSISSLVSMSGVEGIFHLGMPSSTLLYRESPALVKETASDFVDLLEYCRRTSTRMVFASSSSLYNGNQIPFREDMAILPKDLYTETRLFMERLSAAYGEMFGTSSLALRLFSVYGEREESKGMLANVLTQMVWARERGEPFDVYEPGASRDFIHVSDVVRAFQMAMCSDATGVLNIGTGKSRTMKDISHALGVRTRKVENPIKNYVRETLADTSKARSVLGFSARVDVMDYISSLG